MMTIVSAFIDYSQNAKLLQNEYFYHHLNDTFVTDTCK